MTGLRMRGEWREDDMKTNERAGRGKDEMMENSVSWDKLPDSPLYTLHELEMTVLVGPEHQKDGEEDGGGEQTEHDGSCGDDAEHLDEGHGGEDQDAEACHRGDR